MVVYAEYLFLENFITSLVLVYFTSRLTGTAAKWYRLVAGAVLGGISSFLLFLPMGAAAAVLTRGAAAVVICGFSLGGVNLWRKTAVFFILSFLSGLLSCILPNCSFGQVDSLLQHTGRVP